MSKYAWCITDDHLYAPLKLQEMGLPSRAGHYWTTTTTEPTFNRVAVLANGKKFRLYDDDGELHFSGRYLGSDSEDMFAPLDWAMADSGCTSICYLNDETGNWEQL